MHRSSLLECSRAMHVYIHGVIRAERDSLSRPFGFRLSAFGFRLSAFDLFWCKSFQPAPGALASQLSEYVFFASVFLSKSTRSAASGTLLNSTYAGPALSAPNTTRLKNFASTASDISLLVPCGSDV
jgi:hypothetical protein